MPYLRLARYHIGCHAHKRHRKIPEVHRVLIAYCQGTYEVAYILAIYISGRKTSQQVLFQEIGSVLIIGSDMEDIMLMYRVETVLVLNLHPEIILVIEERDRNEILLLVFHVRIGNVLPREFVAQGPVPVHVTDNGVHLFGRVAQGIEAADKAAHACTQNHIHRDSEFFDVFDDSDMSRTFGTASAEDKSYSRAILAYFIHPHPHSFESGRISRRIDALGMKTPAAC